MEASPGAWSLVPPLVALSVALTTRRVGAALAAAGLCGTGLLAWLDGRSLPAAAWVGALDFVRIGILGQPSEPDQAQVLVLIALIGGFVHTLETSGAGRALVTRITAGVRTARGVQLATWLGGVVLFFSDLGNVLILGPMFRAVYDRMGLPRERLAWIVDTTAAPVSVLIPFVAWGVYVIGLVEAAFRDLDPGRVERVLPGRWVAEAGTVDGLAAFLDALPFQMYAWCSLLFVPALIVFGRPFGPMVRAVPVPPREDEQGADDPPAIVGALPVLVLFAVLAGVGGAEVAAAGRLTGPAVRTALATAYLAATGVLLALLRASGREGGRFFDGLGRSAPLLGILVLAWTLGEVCARLRTGAFLAGLVGGDLPAELLPAATFAAGAVMSFATGTSWGTFAILMPIVVPLSIDLGAPAPIAIGAVLSGGVFGDHCSPISDTTLLASLGSGSDHARHVATQLPYALATGVAAMGATIVAGATGSGWSAAVGAAAVLGIAGASRLAAPRT